MTAAPMRTDGKLTVALVSEVFWEPDGKRDSDRLREAVERGADLAMLPELPLNPWARQPRLPATTTPSRWMAPVPRRRATRVRSQHRFGRRHHPPRRDRSPDESRARFDRAGALRATYELHLPDEEGFWGEPLRARHRSTAEDRRIRRADRRPAVLGQQPAGGDAPAGRAGRGRAMLNPRASEERTYQRWKTVLARERPDELLLRAEREPAAPRAGRPDRRTQRGNRPRRGCWSRRRTPSRWSRSTRASWPMRVATTPATSRCALASTPMPGPRSRRRTATRGTPESSALGQAEEALPPLSSPANHQRNSPVQSWMKPAALPRL